MKTTFSMWVAGTPRPQPRPRFVKGRVISTVDAGTKAWQHAIRSMAYMMRGEPITGAVRCRLRFDMPIKDAKRHGQPHTGRPDVDNLAKLVMDQLTAAGIWGDDAKVASLECHKVYAAKGGVGVEIESI